MDFCHVSPTSATTTRVSNKVRMAASAEWRIGVADPKMSDDSGPTSMSQKLKRSGSVPPRAALVPVQ